MIRPMTAQDIPVLIDMGAAMHKESRYAKLDFDPGSCATLAKRFWATLKRGLCWSLNAMAASLDFVSATLRRISSAMT
jgi:hypothetical protein